jgi:hypothetical protein
MAADPTEYRLRLRRARFDPLPLDGKRPPLKEWQKQIDSNDATIRLWGQLHPYSTNTGVLTRLAPAIDIDITNPEAAEAIEGLARERFEGRGHILVRIGKSPKRAILLRTLEPFKKLSELLIAPNGDTEQKIEILGDGQQLVVDGIHPDTKQPYGWHGGEPGQIKLDELPDISADEARAFLDAAVELLERDHGYRRAGRNGAGGGNGGGAGPGGEGRAASPSTPCRRSGSRPIVSSRNTPAGRSKPARLRPTSQREQFFGIVPCAGGRE